MKIAPLADVKARLRAYLDHAETEGPVVITRNGKPVAVLISPRDDADLETLVLSRSPRFQALLEKSRESVRTGTGLSEKSSGRQSTGRRNANEFWLICPRARRANTAFSPGVLGGKARRSQAGRRSSPPRGSSPAQTCPSCSPPWPL